MVLFARGNIMVLPNREEGIGKHPVFEWISVLKVTSILLRNTLEFFQNRIFFFKIWV